MFVLVALDRGVVFRQDAQRVNHTGDDVSELGPVQVTTVSMQVPRSRLTRRRAVEG